MDTVIVVEKCLDVAELITVSLVAACAGCASIAEGWSRPTLNGERYARV